MRRKLFNFAAVVSLLLLLVTVGLWVSSYWWWTVSPSRWNVGTRQHWIWLFPHGIYYVNIPLEWDIIGDEFNFSDDPWLVFRVISHTTQTRQAVFLVIPYKTPAIVFALLPTLRLLTIRRRTRPTGTCSKCGYDLTGNTSGICPECGTPVAGKTGAKA